MTIDTSNMCSHLQKKLFEEDGIYHPLWMAMQDNPNLTAVVRSDLADDEAGRFPKDLKRGVLSEDGIWNLLSDYRDLNSNKN